MTKLTGFLPAQTSPNPLSKPGTLYLCILLRAFSRPYDPPAPLSIQEMGPFFRIASIGAELGSNVQNPADIVPSAQGSTREPVVRGLKMTAQGSTREPVARGL